jgi:hypothetical protein
MRIVATLLNGFLVLLLLASAYLGLTGGFALVREAHSFAQKLATGTELLYGLTALVVLVAMAEQHRRTLLLLIVWAGALTATGALAPVVWGNTSVKVGAESGAGVGLVLVLVLWAWHFVRRRAAAGRAGFRYRG